NTNENPLDTEAIVEAFQNKVFNAMDAEKQLNAADNHNSGNNKSELFNGYSNLDDNNISTCKPLKAATTTKTQRQQNEQRRHEETRTATTVAVVAAAAAPTITPTAIRHKTKAVVCKENDGDAGNMNKHNNHSNSKHQSIRRNQTRRINVVDNSNNNNTNYHTNNSHSNGNGIGKQHHHRQQQQHRGSSNNSQKKIADSTSTIEERETSERITQRAEYTKINKSNKHLMNEVNIGDEDRQIEDKKVQQQENWQEQQQKRQTNKNFQHRNDDDNSSYSVIGNRYMINISPSSSDSEAGHNPKLKTNPSYYLQPRPSNRSKKSSSLCSRSCTTQTTPTRPPPPLPKLRSRKKRQPLTPPAPSVTPSSSLGHLSQSRCHIPLEELQIPLTANASDLQSMQNYETFEPPFIEDDSENGSEMECNDRDVVSQERRRSERSVATSKNYVDFPQKSSIPLYLNKSPYTTSDNTPRRLRPVPAKELQKLQPKPSPKLITEQLAQSISFKENQSPATERNAKANDSKIDHRYEKCIQKRNEFLKSCEKNRFYKNPNFSEPWKVFATISERLLDEALHDIENDFTAGVTKFVDDFLELEIKS
ncbi:GATA zinc finger domain-containing protein 14-like, partial [Musca vetustissima]|uniref:GATA zinc finger domain-containing protein 14-like n=1 Tax=Musca vetustissima TaxID=27455 RepID=UPI002AB67665